ncbi:CPBP family intramembrane metalloprotease [Candidatus Saccharibacteria bacterium]|nr:CPBP family intramembrane metalloprotease [Candidatus Saccharibacteria bacterium]
MFRNYSKKLLLRSAIVLPAWMIVGMYVASMIIALGYYLFGRLGLSFESINENVLSTVLAVLLYVISAMIIIGVPYILTRKKPSLNDLGFSRLPTWTDILIAPAGFVIYIILSSILLMTATHLLPWFNPEQVQNTGFGNFGHSLDLVLAFIMLVVVAPLAEETLFRGYLFSRLRRDMPLWLATILTSVVFGFVHGAWNLAFDTFALSLVLCTLREYTSSIWASVLLHMIKNALAFYILFIVH